MLAILNVRYRTNIELNYLPERNVSARVWSA
jgi:hypothetical protein